MPRTRVGLAGFLAGAAAAAGCLPSYPSGARGAPDDGGAVDGSSSQALQDGAAGEAMAAAAEGGARDAGIADARADVVEAADSGSAGQACDGGRVACDGGCVDDQTDPQNCGGCGVTCPISCARGACLKPVAIAVSNSDMTACAVLSDRCLVGRGYDLACLAC